MNYERLLNVALACEDAAKNDHLREHFNMERFVHYNECGTPGCAFGNYAARRDLQRDYKIVKKVADEFAGSNVNVIEYNDTEGLGKSIGSHFDISRAQVEELFGVSGSGGSVNQFDPIGVALYIRKFVHQHGGPKTYSDQQQGDQK